jgi:hypothetical protein
MLEWMLVISVAFGSKPDSKGPLRA